MISPARAKVLRAARGWVGTPYVHQASTKGAGTDCLGFVRGVWREVVGAETEVVPSYTADWGEVAGREVLWQAANRHLKATDLPGQAGDVVLFRMRDTAIAKHLGILTEQGDGFIHAFTGHGVVENSMSDPWRRRVVAAFEFPLERI